MPFDVGETINNIADAILRAPAVDTVARSPIYTGLLITFVIVLIIMFIFRDADTDESLLVMCLRSGFWTFLFLICILFLHNKILTKETTAARSHIYDGAFSDRALTPQVGVVMTPAAPSGSYGAAQQSGYGAAQQSGYGAAQQSGYGAAQQSGYGAAPQSGYSNQAGRAGAGPSGNAAGTASA